MEKIIIWKKEKVEKEKKSGRKEGSQEGSTEGRKEARKGEGEKMKAKEEKMNCWDTLITKYKIRWKKYIQIYQ